MYQPRYIPVRILGITFTGIAIEPVPVPVYWLNRSRYRNIGPTSAIVITFTGRAIEPVPVHVYGLNRCRCQYLGCTGTSAGIWVEPVPEPVYQSNRRYCLYLIQGCTGPGMPVRFLYAEFRMGQYAGLIKCIPDRPIRYTVLERRKTYNLLTYNMYIH